MKLSWTLGAGVAFMVVAGGVAAQGEAYKCGPDSYAQHPCSDKVVNTEEHRAPPAKRGGTVIAHRLPGETDAEFALRQRRAHLSETDRDECARLDKRIPFEQERLKNTVRREEAEQAQESLTEARQRFGRLRC